MAVKHPVSYTQAQKDEAKAAGLSLVTVQAGGLCVQVGVPDDEYEQVIEFAISLRRRAREREAAAKTAGKESGQ